MKTVVVIDAQGGGIGKQLILSLRKEMSDIRILAVGTNSVATGAMLKAGADEAATGENAVVVASKKADVIIGPIGIVMTDAMLGEITATMANAVSSASATRILIPFQHCDTYIVGVENKNITKFVQDAIVKAKELLK